MPRSTKTMAASPKGSTSKYCTCTDHTGRKLGVKCPKLKRGDGRWSTAHGMWRFQLELPPNKDGSRRNPLRRVGFATETEALEEMGCAKELLSIAGGKRATAIAIADHILATLKATKRLPDADTVRRKIQSRVDLAASMTVSEWLREFLHRKRRVAKGTLKGYETHVRLYLEPCLGHLALDEVTVGDVATVFDAIEEFNDQLADLRASKDPQVRAQVKYRRTVGVTTMYRIRATLRAALNIAIKQDRLIDFNPAAVVEMPPQHKPVPLVWTTARQTTWRRDFDARLDTATPYTGRKRVNAIDVYQSTPRPSPVMVWTPEQATVFLDHARSHRFYPIYRLCLLRGLRRGEAVGLLEAHTRLDDAEIDIAWQITEVSGTPTAKTPKSLASQRTVAIDADTVTAMRTETMARNIDRAEAGDAWTETEYFFTGPYGQPLSPSHVADEFTRIAHHAGLPPIRFHDLRHVAACLMHAAGADIKEIQQTLGHSTMALTADTYTTIFTQLTHTTAANTAALLNTPTP